MVAQRGAVRTPECAHETAARQPLSEAEPLETIHTDLWSFYNTPGSLCAGFVLWHLPHSFMWRFECCAVSTGSVL